MADASELNLAVEAKFEDTGRCTPEELVAKAIAPVKYEFLLPPPLRRCTEDKNVDFGAKKSKRQLKRERLQVKPLCPEIARTGNVSSCPYSEKCRFSHDLDAFKAEKPADLEGNCPFMNLEAKCPYGLTCRFENAHRVDNSEAFGVQKGLCELNMLNKDVQRLLWKCKMKFPKADAKLKFLGLVHNKGKVNSKRQILEEKGEADQIISNGFHPVQEANYIEACNLDNYVESSTEVTVHKTCTDEAVGSVNFVDSCPEVPFYENCSDIVANSVHNTVSYPKVLVDEKDSGEHANLDNYIKASPKMVEVDHGNGTFIADELRPPKRARAIVDEKCCSDEISNGLLVSMGCRDISAHEIQIEESCKMTGSECNADSFSTESDLSLKPHLREKNIIDFSGKLYLAPLTTVGNLPFRRVCKMLGADVTCGEMAMCTNLLQGQASEWSLLRRHSTEDLFGVQICTSYPDIAARTVELINQECTVDFIDINMGCPIDLVVNKGAGSFLLSKPSRMENIIKAASATVDKPITVKVRTGFFEGKNRISSIITDIPQWGASAVTIHGRSRQQRYTKVADWDYIYECTRKTPKELQVLGNGDILSYLDWNSHMSDCPQLSSCMIARGALIKPWLFTEIKEQRDWDISSGERFDMLKDFVRFSLQHWGSDTKGVETSRHFLLEWLSYTCRYIPVGLLDVIPQRLNWRPPSYFGRNDLETLLASDSAADWVRLSEMLLGKVPPGFIFLPKHKSNAYDKAENG